MALEKPTRGKPVREREILLLGNLQQNSEIFRPTYLNLEEKFLPPGFDPVCIKGYMMYIL